MLSPATPDAAATRLCRQISPSYYLHCSFVGETYPLKDPKLNCQIQEEQLLTCPYNQVVLANELQLHKQQRKNKPKRLLICCSKQKHIWSLYQRKNLPKNQKFILVVIVKCWRGTYLCMLKVGSRPWLVAWITCPFVCMDDIIITLLE